MSSNTIVCASKYYFTQSTNTIFYLEEIRNYLRHARHSLLADLKTLAYMSTDSVNIGIVL